MTQARTAAATERSGPRRRRALPRRAAFIAAALFVVLAGASLHNYPSTLGDNVRYFRLARALAKGEGYRLTYREPPSVERRYPPLFPWLLTPGARLRPDSLRAAKAIPALFGGLCVLLTFWAFRRRLGDTGAAWAAVFVAANPLIFSYSTAVLPETVFITWCLLAFGAAERVKRRAERATRLCAAGLGAAMGAAVLTRIAGLPFLPAVASWAWRRRRRKTALIALVVAGALTAPWFAWSAGRKGEGVVGHFQEALRPCGGAGPAAEDTVERESRISPMRLGRRIARNIGPAFASAARLLLPSCYLLRISDDNFPFCQQDLPTPLSRGFKRHAALSWTVGAALWVFLAAGLLRVWRAGPRLADWFVAWYVLMVVAYAPLEDRFIIPLIPMLAAYVWMGGAAIGRRMRTNARPGARAAGRVGLSLIIALNAALTARMARAYRALPPARGPATSEEGLVQCYAPDHWAPLLVLATRLARSVPPQAVIMWSVTDAGPCYVFSGRRICETPDTRDLRFIRRAIEQHADYIVMWGSPELIDARREVFRTSTWHLEPRDSVSYFGVTAQAFEKVSERARGPARPHAR